MTRSNLPVGLGTLRKWKEEKGNLKCTLPYQRHSGMWNLITKSMLVWSLLADSYLPSIVLLKDSDGTDDKGKQQSKYEILDGQQRLTTLFSFMNDEFKLHGSTPEAEVDGTVYDLAGFTFSELSDECKDAITGFRFSVQCIENYTSEEAEMLFANINSGVALSTVQKSKPKLGEEICSYMRDLLEKPFFSQGINITANQALREDDFGLALQSVMLLDSEYNDYKSISMSECLKYAERLRDLFSRSQRDDFSDIISYLGVFNEKTKFLRKNNVPIIIVLAEQAFLNDIEAEGYKAFLSEFFLSESEDYKEFSGSGNVKRVNVEGRLKVLKDAFYKYFRMTPPVEENTEATEDSVSNGVCDEDQNDVEVISNEYPIENTEDNLIEPSLVDVDDVQTGISDESESDAESEDSDGGEN